MTARRSLTLIFSLGLAVSAAGAIAMAQRGGGPAGPRSRPASSRSASATWAPPLRVASRPRSACPAIRRRTISAPRRAACGNPPTAAQRGAPIFDDQAVARRLAPWPSSPSDPNRSGPAPARRGSSATATSWATASTSRPTPARPGRTWACPRTGPHRPHHRPPDEPEHRLRLRDRPRDRAAAGARRLSHDRRRRDVGAACSSSNRDTGCSGLSLDPTDPNTLIAGMWQVELHTWAEFSGGPGQRRLPHARRRHDVEEGRQPACRSRRSARSTSRSRRRIRSACTR